MSIKPFNVGKVGDVISMVSTGVVGWTNPEKNREKLELVRGNNVITITTHPNTKEYLVYLPIEAGKKGEALIMGERGILEWGRDKELEKRIEELEKKVEKLMKPLTYDTIFE